MEYLVLIKYYLNLRQNFKRNATINDECTFLQRIVINSIQLYIQLLDCKIQVLRFNVPLSTSLSGHSGR